MGKTNQDCMVLSYHHYPEPFDTAYLDFWGGALIFET